MAQQRAEKGREGWAHSLPHHPSLGSQAHCWKHPKSPPASPSPALSLPTQLAALMAALCPCRQHVRCCTARQPSLGASMVELLPAGTWLLGTSEGMQCRAPWQWDWYCQMGTSGALPAPFYPSKSAEALSEPGQVLVGSSVLAQDPHPGWEPRTHQAAA